METTFIILILFSIVGFVLWRHNKNDDANDIEGSESSLKDYEGKYWILRNPGLIPQGVTITNNEIVTVIGVFNISPGVVMLNIQKRDTNETFQMSESSFNSAFERILDIDDRR